MSHVSLAGIKFLSTKPKQAADHLITVALSGSASHVHLANAYTIALADKHPAYRELLNSGLVLPDGKPLSWASSLLRLKPRLFQVRGPQLFLDVLDRGRKFGLRHFFLGDTEYSLALLQQRVESDFPDVKIVGSYSPPFKEMSTIEKELQDRMVQASGAHIVWVGLGTPKQDFEAERISHATSTTTVAVGAAFSFTAGIIKSAPLWMQRIGFEWLFRLLSEPRRLWKRYVFGNPRFVFATIRNLRFRSQSGD